MKCLGKKLGKIHEKWHKGHFLVSSLKLGLRSGWTASTKNWSIFMKTGKSCHKFDFAWHSKAPVALDTYPFYSFFEVIINFL